MARATARRLRTPESLPRRARTLAPPNRPPREADEKGGSGPLSSLKYDRRRAAGLQPGSRGALDPRLVRKHPRSLSRALGRHSAQRVATSYQGSEVHPAAAAALDPGRPVHPTRTGARLAARPAAGSIREQPPGGRLCADGAESPLSEFRVSPVYP